MNTDPEKEYRLGKLLGQDVFGSVYIGERLSDSAIVAIKVIPAVANAQIVSEEIENLKNCNSKYIIHYNDIFQKDNTFWIIMEYCHYGSLKSYIQHGFRLKENEVQDVLSCSLFGLMYLHNKNIIHHDIKPGNLFFTEVGGIKIGDLGVSTQIDSSISQRNGGYNVYMYMAPEIFDGNITKKSDIWALGITAIELVEGKNPYANCTKNQIMKRVLLKPSPCLSASQWSSDFVDFVNKCLIKDMNERPSAAELANHPFVKDAMERIQNEGKSEVLLQLMKLSFNPNPVPNPVSTANSIPNPNPNSIPTLNLVPTPKPNSTANPISNPIPTLNPVPNPNPNSIPTPNPVPNSNPIPTPNLVPTLNPTPNPNSTLTPNPLPNPKPHPIPNSFPTPNPLPNPNSVPTSNPISNPIPTPNSNPTPKPNSTANPISNPIPTPNPIPNPVPTPNSVPTPKPKPTINPISTPNPKLNPIPNSTPIVSSTPNPTPIPPINPISTSTPTPNPPINPISTSTPTPNPPINPISTPNPKPNPIPNSTPIITSTPINPISTSTPTPNPYTNIHPISTLIPIPDSIPNPTPVSTSNPISTSNNLTSDSTPITSSSLHEMNTLYINNENDFCNISDNYDSIYTIQVASNIGNDDKRIEWDLSKYSMLKQLIIGDNCLNYLQKCIIHNTQIETIQIGANSCNKCTTFEVKQCDYLKSITIGDNSFIECEQTIIEACSQLQIITLGKDVFSGNDKNQNRLILKNLTALTEMKGEINVFSNIKEVTIENIPNVNTLQLLNAFNSVENVSLQNASMFETIQMLKEAVERKRREEEERKRREEEEKRRREYIIINNAQDWQNVTSDVVELTVVSNCCNDDNLTVIDFSPFKNLKTIKIGDDCFIHAKEIRFSNMQMLEKIEIGSNSFTENMNSYSLTKQEAHFICTDNIQLVSLIIGCYSFNQFSECKLENCSLLESIIIGDMNTNSYNFYNGDLNISNCHQLQSITLGWDCFKNGKYFNLSNLPKLQGIKLGDRSFKDSIHTVIEDLPLLEQLDLGREALKGNCDYTDCSLTLRNLPLLSHITSCGGSFYYPRSVILENIPNINHVDLSDAFLCVESYTIHNVDVSLANWIQAYKLEKHLQSFSQSINRIELEQEVYKKVTSLDLSRFTNLTTLIIHIDNFNLPQLQTIKLGNYCFENGDFNVSNLPQLQTITLGDNCFKYGNFSLSNVPQLQNMTIGDECFSDSNYLPQLQTITLGKECFKYFIIAKIENLPQLKQITLGEEALLGNSDDNRSILTIRNLPELTEMNGKDNFKNPHSVVLKNIPNITHVELPGAFKEVKSRKIKNVAECLAILVPENAEKGCCCIY